MGRRRRKRQRRQQESEQAARDDARRRAEAEAERVRVKHEADMATMQAKIDTVAKTKVYSPTSKTSATTGQMSQGLDRGRKKAKTSRAMKTSKTRIKLDPMAEGLRIAARGTGQVNV